MLESVLGVRLLLWTGNPIPTPSPTLLEPLRSVEVRNDVESGDGFQLTFALTKDMFGGTTSSTPWRPAPGSGSGPCSGSCPSP